MPSENLHPLSPCEAKLPNFRWPKPGELMTSKKGKRRVLSLEFIKRTYKSVKPTIMANLLYAIYYALLHSGGPGITLSIQALSAQHLTDLLGSML